MKKIIIALIFALLITPITVNSASVSFFTSGGGTVNYGTTINVTVTINSPDTYNAVDLAVNYSNLNFVSASVVGGWTGVAGPSNTGSSVTFSGALLGSTATGNRSVLNLTFSAPNSAVTGTIGATGTIALADGNGTPVNGGGNTITYTVVAPPAPTPAPPPSNNPAPTPTPTPNPTTPSAPVEPLPQTVKITSTSHPDQETWYNKEVVEFSWNKEDKVTGFSYTLDQNADTNPDESIENSNTSVSFSNLLQGVSYFHIKAQNSSGWGPTSHYKIKIDSVAPDPFGIAISENDDGSKYLIYFATNDSTSGVEYFNIVVDGLSYNKINTGYEVEKNAKEVEVIAFDEANNFTARKIVIDDESINVINSDSNITNQSSINLSVAALGVLFVLIIESIGVLIYIFFKKNLYRVSTSKLTDPAIPSI